MHTANNHASILSCLQETVVDTDGEPTGEICDLLLNRRSGHIEFVRVAISRQSTEDRRYVTIPWSALRVPANKDTLWSVRAKRATLEKMARRTVTF